jgi:hypothetical protein
MNDHHLAWLSAHPKRTEDWLKARVNEGFDVHHIDGDHSNNDPLNLVLIESVDHMMLHNGNRKLERLVRSNGRWSSRSDAAALRLEKSKKAYELKLELNGWREVAVEMGVFENGNKFFPNKYRVKALAKQWAESSGANWPI